MEAFAEQMDTLMRAWNAAHKARGLHSFIADGAVDEAAYLRAAPRVCFFLKEAYSKDSTEDWSLTQWLAGGALTRMWSNAAEWAYGILHTSPSDIPPRPQLSSAKKTALLRQTAVVNVKKSNGTSASCYDELLAYAAADRDFLRRELELLAPTVIVCGNNSGLLRSLYDDEDVGCFSEEFLRGHGYALAGGRIVLDFYHPANRYPARMNYYTLCCLYQQALRQRP